MKTQVIHFARAVRLDTRCWVLVVRQLNGEFHADGCKTVGYGYGLSPEDAVADAERHGGFARGMHETRRETLSNRNVWFQLMLDAESEDEQRQQGEYIQRRWDKKMNQRPQAQRRRDDDL